MATKVQQVTVSDQASLDSTLTGYIASGFVVQNRTPEKVILFKKKEFSILWAVIGLVFCALPLLIYLIVYATQSDELVEVIVQSEVQWSEDGHYWWDGSQWVLAEQGQAVRSPEPSEQTPPPPQAGTHIPQASASTNEPEDDFEIIIRRPEEGEPEGR